MNHLNEALFLRTEDGKLSYCNNLGVKIVEQSCKDVFEDDTQLVDYCQRLSSLDFLVKNILV